MSQPVSQSTHQSSNPFLSVLNHNTSQSALHNQSKKELTGPSERTRCDSDQEKKVSCGKKLRADPDSRESSSAYDEFEYKCGSR